MSIQTYRDFVLLTDYVEDSPRDAQGRPAAYSVRVFDSPAGEGEQEEIVHVAGWDELDEQRRSLASRDLQDEARVAFCRALGDLLFPPYARQMFQRSKDIVNEREGEGLRIRLRLLQELAYLPWEYSLVQLTGGEAQRLDYLGLDPRLSLVRHEEIAVPGVPFRTGDRRRVLVAMASPPGEARLDLRGEQTAIRSALASIPGVEVGYLPDYTADEGSPGATRGDVQTALATPTDIFHFSGHGRFVREPGPAFRSVQGQGEIVLAGPQAQADSVPADEVGSWLNQGHVRLAVLDACETGEADVFQRWSGVARALLKSGVPAVVAMQFSVYDDLAAEFSRAFYNNLVAGSNIDEAVAQGRQRMASKRRQDRDWGAPVLFLRNSGGRLFGAVQDAEARAEATTTAGGMALLSDSLLRWLRQGAPADPADLDALRRAGDRLDIGPLESLVLLRAAVVHQHDIDYWVARVAVTLAAGAGRGTERGAGETAVPGDDGLSEEARDLLALNDLAGDSPAALPPHLQGDLGRLVWTAVHHADPVVRQTDTLALLAWRPDDVLRDLDAGLDTIADARTRRRRRGELFGLLSETGPHLADQVRRRADNVQDRIAVWRWRAGRMAGRQWPALRRTALRGAVAAGVALGAYRMLLAIPLARNPIGPAFAINSYWGFVLGLALIAGMMAAGPLLLLDPRRATPAQTRRADWLGVALGGVCFGAANVLVALVNENAGPLGSLATFLPATVVGLGLAVGLFGRPRAAPQESLRPGIGGWAPRLAAAFGVCALAQAPALCEAAANRGGAWLASSIFFGAEWFVYSLSYIPALKALFDQCEPRLAGGCCFACVPAGSGFGGWCVACLEQGLSMLDAGLVGLVMVIGINAGLHWPVVSARFRRRPEA